MHRWHVVVLAFTLAALAAACGPSTPLPATSTASTEAILQEIETGVAATLTAGAPTATPVPSSTPVPTDTATSPPTSTPTRTPRPSATASATARASDTPAPTSTSTRVPATLAPPTATVAPTPDFVGIALAVRAQVDDFGWQIDLALRSGGLDCSSSVNAYEYVAARATLAVPDSLAGPYQLYTDGVSIFLSNSEALYVGCRDFLAGTSTSGTVSRQAWTNARTKVNEAHAVLTQAIVAAGGTP